MIAKRLMVVFIRGHCCFTEACLRVETVPLIQKFLLCVYLSDLPIEMSTKDQMKINKLRELISQFFHCGIVSVK